MKAGLFLATASMALTASAHCTPFPPSSQTPRIRFVQANNVDVFPALIQDNQPTGDWKYVRDWTGSYTNGPVTDVNSMDIRCNKDGFKHGNSTETLPVKAGEQIGFTVRSSIIHPGPLMAYMAKAPGDASDFEGDGQVWFKISQDEPTVSDGGLDWPSEGIPPVPVFWTLWWLFVM